MIKKCIPKNVELEFMCYDGDNALEIIEWAEADNIYTLGDTGILFIDGQGAVREGNFLVKITKPMDGLLYIYHILFSEVIFNRLFEEVK